MGGSFPGRKACAGPALSSIGKRGPRGRHGRRHGCAWLADALSARPRRPRAAAVRATGGSGKTGATLVPAGADPSGGEGGDPSGGFFHSAKTRGKKPAAKRDGRPPHPAATRLSRPHRSASDAGGDRRDRKSTRLNSSH